MAGIGDVLDLDRYPLDRPASARGRALAAECRAALDRDGLFNKGKNTAHRISPVIGPRERMTAVFSYYELPGVLFSEEERIGFYGRAG